MIPGSECGVRRRRGIRSSAGGSGGRFVLELSADGGNVNTLDELSTGPADRGGVAVIVLGYTKSICWGETGCAVNGVPG